MYDKRDGEGMRRALLEILDQAMGAVGARCGNIQVYDAASGALHIVVQRGLPADVAQLWHTVHTTASTVCARSWRAQHRVCVPDLAKDELFAPYLPTAERLGLRAVQSTPLPGATHPVGVMSTHFSASRVPSPAEEVLLDECAQRAARTITAFAAAA